MLLVLVVLWGLVVTGQSAVAASSDVERRVEYELARLSAANPLARARASDELRRLASDPANAAVLQRNLAPLRPSLSDAHPVVRWNAAVVLARVGGPDEAEAALQTLEKDAADPLYSRRLGVVEALADIASARARALLGSIAQNDEDDEVRSAAADALQRGPAPRPPVDAAGVEGRPADALPGGDGDRFFALPSPPEERPSLEGTAALLARAHEAILHLPDSAALEALAEITQYRRGFVMGAERVTLPDALRPAVQTLLRFLRREAPPPPMDVRNAAKVLGSAGPEAVGSLIAALESPAEHTRAAAAFALLWSATNPDGTPRHDVSRADVASALVFSLADESADVRAYAALAIGNIGATAYADDVARLLADVDPHVRAGAVRALATLAPQQGQGLPVLMKDLRSDDVVVRGIAAETVGAVGDAAFVEELGDMLRSDAPGLAYSAAAALAALQQRRAIAVLTAAQDDPRPWVRRAVAAALTSLFGTHGVLPSLSAQVLDRADAALTGEVVAGGGFFFFAPTPADMPLPGARVVYSGPAQGEVATDALGRFRIEDAPPGVYTFRVEADGYLSLERSVFSPTARSDGPAPTDLRIRLHRR